MKQSAIIMKQLAIVMAMMLSAVTANAQLKFKLIETNDSTTTFVFVDSKMGREAKASDASLYNDGNNYPSLSIASKYENCANTYTVTFPRQPALNKTTVMLMINGKKHIEYLWDQITEATMRHHINITGSKTIIINP